ncbi:hypothetical protein RFF05_09965 [Bengtsoniella intestinalis]|uniref:plasmid mobilization protein n=1 Tax=Bengtsoniella intestinalis TaxID=3073143 RepID=UPI00391F2E28
MSPQEAERLDRMVALSGLCKQEYLCKRVLQEDVVVRPSPRILKSLKAQLEQLHQDVEKIAHLEDADAEFVENLLRVTTLLAGLKEVVV